MENVPLPSVLRWTFVDSLAGLERSQVAWMAEVELGAGHGYGRCGAVGLGEMVDNPCI